MAERKRIDPDVEARVLLRSARRCCLCFYERQDLEPKLGQIAHIDQDSSNASEDNLVFLCLEHHTIYDSRTSQHKNFTIKELVAVRERLYERIQLGTAANSPAGSNGSLTQSGGVNFGTSTVQVYGDVVGGHKTATSKAEALRERGEELHGLIDKWLGGLAGHYLRRNSVMQGQLTYNQCLDLDIAQGNAPFDFSRIELLIDLYFSTVRPAYDRTIEARTVLNRIASTHKRAYEQGDIDGSSFLRPYVEAQKVLEARGDDLKKELVEAIRFHL